LNISVDENLDALLYQCLAINPRDRFQNAIELKKALDGWMPGTRKRKKKMPIESEHSTFAKTALGPRSALNEQQARSMIQDALRMSCYVEKLNEAADLMEEAFNHCPPLRKKYECKVTLWRKGISGG